MSERDKIGRLAFRAEGANWNAYYAMSETMERAIFLGSIKLAIAMSAPAHKQAFMDLMRAVVSDMIANATGETPTWGGPQSAPEHERSGNA